MTLGLIYVYNSLPQLVVDQGSVSAFQRALQNGVRRACEQSVEKWPELLRKGPFGMSLSEFQLLFPSLGGVDNVIEAM